MVLLLLFILAGAIVIVGMLIWSVVVWLMGITSRGTWKSYQESISRSPHKRRLHAFWIIYIVLLILVIAHGFSQGLSDKESHRGEKKIGFGQTGSNVRVGAMSEIAEN